VFKRILWLIIGASFGFGVAFWLTRFVRETVNRYSPENVSANLAEALKSLGQDLRAAIAEGREGMRDAEAELHAKLDIPTARVR